MRTQDEIFTRVKTVAKNDYFGFEAYEYLRALGPSYLEQLKGTVLKEDADLSRFTPDLTSDKAITTQCIDYMAFAWEKANNCRGISAARSMAHYKAWLWMLGRDEFEDIEDYCFYGKGELVKICDFLGIDSNAYDDGVRTNADE